jgi:hypothetical protein
VLGSTPQKLPLGININTREPFNVFIVEDSMLFRTALKRTLARLSFNVSGEAVNGFLLDVFLDYHASAPATTDVTIAYDTNPGTIITVISNNKTDGIYVPRIQACDAAGAAIAGIYDRYVISGRLKVSVAQADALAPAVTAWFRVLVIE